MFFPWLGIAGIKVGLGYKSGWLDIGTEAFSCQSYHSSLYVFCYFSSLPRAFVTGAASLFNFYLNKAFSLFPCKSLTSSLYFWWELALFVPNFLFSFPIISFLMGWPGRRIPIPFALLGPLLWNSDLHIQSAPASRDFSTKNTVQKICCKGLLTLATLESRDVGKDCDPHLTYCLLVRRVQ